MRDGKVMSVRCVFRWLTCLCIPNGKVRTDIEWFKVLQVSNILNKLFTLTQTCSVSGFYSLSPKPPFITTSGFIYLVLNWQIGLFIPSLYWPNGCHCTLTSHNWLSHWTVPLISYVWSNWALPFYWKQKMSKLDRIRCITHMNLIIIWSFIKILEYNSYIICNMWYTLICSP